MPLPNPARPVPPPRGGSRGGYFALSYQRLIKFAGVPKNRTTFDFLSRVLRGENLSTPLREQTPPKIGDFGTPPKMAKIPKIGIFRVFRLFGGREGIPPIAGSGPSSPQVTSPHLTSPEDSDTGW